MPHRNSSLSETGRLRLARCVVEDRWPIRRAAERFQISHTTAARWAARPRHPARPGRAHLRPKGKAEAPDRAGHPLVRARAGRSQPVGATGGGS